MGFSRQISIVFFLLFHCISVWARESIDVIIPAAEKDLGTLDLCIKGIRQNCSQVKRVIVISNRKLTDQAEWFNEKKFPFSIQEVARHLPVPKDSALTFKRTGWYFQQLLKLYACYVIPKVSSNVLCLDADTIFLNQVEFIDSSGTPLYNPGIEYHKPYFIHMQKLLPGLDRFYAEHSGISHHMLFQKEALNDLFKRVELQHSMEFWKAFCVCVDPEEVSGSGASEYETYFNFLSYTSRKARIRKLKWDNIQSLTRLSQYKREKYHYVSCHVYLE